MPMKSLGIKWAINKLYCYLVEQHLTLVTKRALLQWVPKECGSYIINLFPTPELLFPDHVCLCMCYCPPQEQNNIPLIMQEKHV